QGRGTSTVTPRALQPLLPLHIRRAQAPLTPPTPPRGRLPRRRPPGREGGASRAAPRAECRAASPPPCCAASPRRAGDVTAQVSLQPALKFNGGGHINHTIFWTNLSPNGGGEPKGELMEAIKRDFGSFANFKEKLTAVSVGVQGSGWGWLGYNKEQGRLQIAACANQDPLQGTTGLIPLLGIDVWEHAYYLQYKNVRPDYLKAIWNVINWENVSSRYASCKK
uniref:Superoxide dismutase n=1 Tax=Anser brachyrhynchus TaxID=132585 RepID=A0A8B9CI41_9AVES